MQCHEVRLSDISLLSARSDSKPEKEAIHSGHFMVSHFEAEAQDDEYEVAIPVPEIRDFDSNIPADADLQVFDVNKQCLIVPPGQLGIETSFTKLFQCMSLAYRQKLTSPKWNRFRGIRLRWKDKIRLNNVIWRCWHMQFIKKENTLVCQFASPLDEGTHNKPEAVVLEGKYWKRKLAAVTAEYKRWRMFYRNKIMGWANKDSLVSDMDIFDWQTHCKDVTESGSMMVDEDYMELMSDTLFSTIASNQPYAFPDTREIARGANLAVFIQPSLVQLQPNLDDFMDTFEPLHEYFSSKLPPVPEDCAVSDVTYRPGPAFSELDVQSQTPFVENLQQTESTDFRIASGNAAPSYQQIMNYNESLPPDSITPGEIKTARFYHSKVRAPQVTYPSLAPRQKSASSSFVAVEPVTVKSTIQSGILSNSFSLENAGRETACEETNFLPPAQANMMQQSFKSSMSPPKIREPSKFQQHYKPAAAYPVPQSDKIVGNRELSASSGPATLPGVTANPVTTKNLPKTGAVQSVAEEDAFIAPNHHLSSSKGRQRTRSGSSLLPGKIREQPPLSSANSDSALNIPGALLAQLLTGNAGMYNVPCNNDRLYSPQSISKSTTVPILPMPVKTSVQSKILPKSVQNTLIMSSGVTPTQGYISLVGPVSSQDSAKESSYGQNVQSHGNLSRSPASPLAFHGSFTSVKANKQDAAKATAGLNEHRRACHINAEQKRRYNIKNGFEILHSLIPHLHKSPNLKLSKAVMLQKGAEYIRQLQSERLQAKEEMEGLKCQIESLSTSISNCQSLLPATGAPVSRHRSTKMREMFDEFVRARTMENWKFWIFSILFEPLLQSFSCSVSTASYEDLYRSTLIWVEQHCSLVDLRPAVFNSLRNLSTSTDILSDPTKLPEEARAAVNIKPS